MARKTLGERVPGLDLEDGLPHVLADRPRLLQLIDDLVDNAVTYAGPRARVTLEAAVVGTGREGVVLTVRDDGPGIAAAELAHVTEFGYVGELGRRRERPGLGLGLWVVGELVAAMGGDMTLASEPGRGCAASVRLPAAPPLEPAP